MPNVIVPDPGNLDQYYIFSSNEWNGSSLSGLHYAVVDITADNGKGDVIKKNVDLLNPATLILSTVNHADDKTFWVMGHEWNTNKFYAYHITESGIQGPVISTIGARYSFWYQAWDADQMCFSPDGSTLAVAAGGNVQLFDFNSNTGALSNVRTVRLNYYHMDGVAFSPNSQLLYASTYENQVLQLDLTNSDSTAITKSAISIGHVDRNILTDLQLAYNGQIYGGRGGGDCCSPLIAIRNPNVKGLACNFDKNGLIIQNDAIYGLPLSIQSYYRDPPTITAPIFCQTLPSQINVSSIGYCDSLLWDFGDGQKVMNKAPVSKSIQHRYGSPGTYTVTLTRFVGTFSKAINGTIEVKEFPNVNLGKDTTLCKGQSLTLSAGNFSQFKWSTGQSDSKIQVTVAGTYWLKVSNGICKNQDTINVSYLNYPEISLPNEIVVCESAKTLAVQDNPLYRYQWSTGSTSSSIMTSSSGSYSVKVYDQQCMTEASSYLKFESTSDLKLNRDNYVLVDSIQAIAHLTASGSNVSKWKWTFGDGDQDTTDIGDIFHNYIAGAYQGTLTGESEGGCSTSVEFSVEVPLIEFVPNVFTPNGDKMNEEFRIFYNGDNTKYKLDVFNRWGELVFSSSHILDCWTAQNDSPGVYYYQVNLGGQLRKGWIQVLK